MSAVVRDGDLLSAGAFPADEAASVPERLEAIAVDIETIQGLTLLRIGERLCEARELFKYNRDEGGFDGWIEGRLSFGRTTAYKLIDVFRAFGSESVHKVDGLPKSVLYALAAPSTPPEVRDELVEKAKSGEKVTPQEVLDLKRKLKEAKVQQQEERDARRAIQGRADEVIAERDGLVSQAMMMKGQIEQLQKKLSGTAPPDPKPSAAPEPEPYKPPAPLAREWSALSSAQRAAFLQWAVAQLLS